MFKPSHIRQSSWLSIDNAIIKSKSYDVFMSMDECRLMSTIENQTWCNFICTHLLQHSETTYSKRVENLQQASVDQLQHICCQQAVASHRNATCYQLVDQACCKMSTCRLVATGAFSLCGSVCVWLKTLQLVYSLSKNTTLTWSCIMN